MFGQEPQALRWTAKKTKKQIARSTHHKDMYIVTDQSGIGFYTVDSSQQTMMANHPPIEASIQWK